MLKIERLGGLAGFGGPNLKSEGQHAFDALAPDDQAKVEHLFSGASTGSPGADGFRYRITREKDGRTQSVEVPEHLVPTALAASVKDAIR
jgi:hypothetical protein